MRTIGWIAVNVFRESVRDKVLYNLVLFAILMMGASYLLGQLTAGQDYKVVIDLGLGAMSLFGLFIAVFIGIGLVSKEVERRSIYGLLAKPIHRYQLVLGKLIELGHKLESAGYDFAAVNIGGGFPVSYVSGEEWDRILGRIRDGFIAAKAASTSSRPSLVRNSCSLLRSCPLPLAAFGLRVSSGRSAYRSTQSVPSQLSGVLISSPNR